MSIENILPKGTTFYNIYSRPRSYASYFVLLEDTERTDNLSAMEFYDSMEAFGGLPGVGYHTTKINLSWDKRAIYGNELKSCIFDSSDIEKLDDFLKLSIKNIREHGYEWNTKKYWEGTRYWRE
jgi:hypothetical protein